VQSHDYIAMERLYEIHESGRYDLIVVDTPPSSHAVDFLDAPERMADFFSSRLLRWLIAPARSRLLTSASRPFAMLADRILGSQFLFDIGEFFLLFQSMYDGFVDRARAVSALLSEERTTFAVISTPEAGAVRDAEFFCKALGSRGLHLGAVVVNRVLPPLFVSERASAAAAVMAASPGKLATDLHLAKMETSQLGEPIDPGRLGAVLTEVAASHQRLEVVARRDEDMAARLASRAELLVRVPLLERDVADLDGLRRVGDHLAGRAGP
jgi:anion-transporting  ArsA/GET3 family ATPase